MRDFYEVLGLSRAATSSEIKAAYKRLAKLYHPDRNPGNKEAEEMFKVVNEAYHTLCNPSKKLEYDYRLQGLQLVIADQQRQYEEQLRRRQYYQWQRSEPRSQYRFDRNYFKIQGLAFLVFLIIAGFCFSIIHTAHYYVEKKHMEKMRFNQEMLQRVNGLFGEGKFSDAFRMINSLEAEDPLDYRFGFARDSLVDALRKQADQKYRLQDFNGAVNDYIILKQYEHPVRFETLQNFSMCQYYLGNYEESLQALKHLHNQDPHNLALIYQIGVINLEKLNNPEEALQYFTLGKKLFKRNLSHVYGNAFEIVMNPTDAPDIYYHIFISRAKSNMKLNNFKDAITDCNWAIFLRRDQGEPYFLRSQASIRQGDRNNLCEDLSKAQALGFANTSHLRSKYCR
jgi:curved DNA-binding protein CbpA